MWHIIKVIVQGRHLPPPPAPLLGSPMALDALEQIQQHLCRGDLSQQPQQDNAAEEVAMTQQHDVDAFLREAVNSRNRITVLRLEQEIEKFVQNATQQDLLLKPMESSYERLAAHRIAQHYGLQSMVVSASFPKVTRILLVKTLETKLPSIRLADIPLERVAADKPVFVSNEKIAIKQRASCGLNGEGLCESSGRTPRKTMEQREVEYDKARARIFNSGDSANVVNRETGIGDGVDRQKLPESLSPSSSRGSNSPCGEGKNQLASSNRVAVFRDREKDMKDPDYDRSYKRYLQPLDPGVSAIFPIMQSVYPPVHTYDKYCGLEGPWAPQLHLEQPTYMPALAFRGPPVESCYPDVPRAHYGQGSDAYWQCQRFPPQSLMGHHNQHLKDGFPYFFQLGLHSTTRLGAAGR